MSKTILLELTEKEAALVQKSVLEHKAKDRNKDLEDPTDYDRRIERCNIILNKAEVALQPQEELLISYRDMLLIISKAMDSYHKLPLDLHISRKKIDQSDIKHIALVNATIMWCNSKNLLKRLAGFDFTDHSYQFEEIND